MTYASTFARMRQLAGNPVLTCVKPRAQWTGTPSGYAYDADYDAFIDNDGDIWRPASTADLNANDYVTVPFLPMSGENTLELSMAGIIDAGSRFGHVLPADKTTVATAQWCELDGYTYNDVALSAMPAGAPQWYVVRLGKR